MEELEKRIAALEVQVQELLKPQSPEHYARAFILAYEQVREEQKPIQRNREKASR